jgi:4-hydroxy-tetrahydrodipicolinate reductase
MTIRVIVNGADGKMGRETVKTIERDSDFELVAKTGRKDDLAAIIAASHAQVVVDFTIASAAFNNASIIIAAGAHPVIGTSGFLPDQIQELQ